jgi:hypothetical protein
MTIGELYSRCWGGCLRYENYVASRLLEHSEFPKDHRNQQYEIANGKIMRTLIRYKLAVALQTLLGIMIINGKRYRTR